MFDKTCLLVAPLAFTCGLFVPTWSDLLFAAKKTIGYLFEWLPQVCINSKEDDVLTLRQHLLVSVRVSESNLNMENSFSNQLPTDRQSAWVHSINLLHVRTR